MSRTKRAKQPCEIARILHIERTHQGLTLKALARATGWTDVAIANMERGGAVKFQIMADCADALGVVILALPRDAWGTKTDARAAARNDD